MAQNLSLLWQLPTSFCRCQTCLNSARLSLQVSLHLNRPFAQSATTFSVLVSEPRSTQGSYRETVLVRNQPTFSSKQTDETQQFQEDFTYIGFPDCFNSMSSHVHSKCLVVFKLVQDLRNSQGVVICRNVHQE